MRRGRGAQRARFRVCESQLALEPHALARDAPHPSERADDPEEPAEREREHERLADARQRSSHWLMREAITQYVEREEKREAFRQEALEAWEAYRATGRHLTSEEADAWLAGLEQGQDVDPPECHD